MFLRLECLPKAVERQQHVRSSWTVTQKNSFFYAHHPATGSRAALKIRQAYPGTYCVALRDGSVRLGYGPTEPVATDIEFLRIILQTDGSISLERDLFATLPLYYTTPGNKLFVSDDYAWVCKAVPRLHVNTAELAALFRLQYPAKPWLLWQELRQLTERETLAYREGKTTCRPAPPRNWRYNQDLPPSMAADFPAFLAKCFNRFTETRLNNHRISFELSGGLDSAFLPLFLSAQGYRLNVPAGTLLQPGSPGQVEKIQILEQQTGLKSKQIRLDATRHLPLADVILSGKCRFFPLGHATYATAMGELLDYFSARGAQVVVTGWGGDQLLEHHPPTSAPDDHPYPPTLLSPIVYHEIAALAGLYIDHDLWPVSPYHSVDLFLFCQALPVQFRANKNIFRAYFEAKAWPSQLYLGDNEDFGVFFDSCLKSEAYASAVEHFSEHSLLHKAGYVDAYKMLDAYKTLLAQNSSEGLFSTYLWLAAEINLRASCK